MQKKCIVCGEMFTKKISCSKRVWAKAKYCSQKCAGLAWKGHAPPKTAFKKGFIPWNKGNHTRLNDCLVKWREEGGGVGDKNPTWKGDKASKKAIAIWAKTRLGSPLKCSKCNEDGKKHQLRWVSISGKYKRDLSDFVTICASCHAKSYVTKKESHHNWKGDAAKYRTIHVWVTYNKGKPKVCSSCGKVGLKSKEIHWSNIDHKYKRNLDDYVALCASCHKRYDLENGLVKH